MLRGRRFPAWLLRRHYFRRLERWAKLQKWPASPGVVVPEPESAPSNVLPFREHSGRACRMPFTVQRGVGTG